MSNEYITLGQALQLDDKTKADILCRLDKCEAKTGKASGKIYFNCKLSWEGAQAWASFFGNSPDPYLNRAMIIRGAEIGSYNGKKQVTAGKFAKIEEYHADFEPTSRPTTSQPQNLGRGSPAPQNAPRAPEPHATGHPVVNGQTVGMAVKAAVDIWISSDCKQGGQSWNAEAAAQVESIARDIVLMSERIQSGAPAENAPPF